MILKAEVTMFVETDDSAEELALRLGYLEGEDFGGAGSVEYVDVTKVTIATDAEIADVGLDEL
jgi:hypothetical protein